jgi:hypothetical protein
MVQRQTGRSGGKLEMDSGMIAQSAAIPESHGAITAPDSTVGVASERLYHTIAAIISPAPTTMPKANTIRSVKRRRSFARSSEPPSFTYRELQQ